MGLFNRKKNSSENDVEGDSVVEADNDDRIDDGKTTENTDVDSDNAFADEIENDDPSSDDSSDDTMAGSGDVSTTSIIESIRDNGPWDWGEKPDRGDKLDFGSLWLDPEPSMTIRLDVVRESGVPAALNIGSGDSNLEIQVFAAPKSSGLWKQVRAELAELAKKNGGSADEAPGPFGQELLTRLPARTGNGRTTHRPIRFVGVDGPRWFIRAVFSGKAAADPDAAAKLEDVLRHVVVVRGTEARPTKELLPLTAPNQNSHDEEAGQDEAPHITLPKRGPEITEVR